MDCVDCHNRATHIYQDPYRAVDEAIARGEIDRSIPFVRRQAVAALTGNYPPNVPAAESIDRDFRGFYAREMPTALHEYGREIEATVAVLQKIYARNIHPRMNVGWNPYPTHIGHKAGQGCARCHNPSMVDASGRAVPHDCTLCHSILAYDSPAPFSFLAEPKPGERQFAMHEYLRGELLKSRNVPGANEPEPLPYPKPMTSSVPAEE
jgi:hypothetical protein